MKQEQFEAKLYRRFKDGIKLLKTTKIWEFNDDCVDYNVWSGAVQEFEKELQEGDYIQTDFEATKIYKNGDGWNATVLVRYK